MLRIDDMHAQRDDMHSSSDMGKLNEFAVIFALRVLSLRGDIRLSASDIHGTP